MTQPTTGEAHTCAANITTLIFNDYGYDFRVETSRQIEWLVDRDTGLPALKEERDRLQLVASNAHEHTAILRERVMDLELALRAVMAHGVTHAVDCSHHDATCSCHKALARQALSNTKEV